MTYPTPRRELMACVNVGATGRGALPPGTAYLGSVSDDPYDIRTRLVVRRPAGRYAFIGTELLALGAASSDPDYIAMVNGGPTRAINERGLAFTWTLAGEREDNHAADGALSPSRFWTTVMECCATLDEALALMPTLPRSFAGTFMLADRAGHLAVVEAGRQVFHVSQRLFPHEGGTAVNVNCWLAMQDEQGLPICAVDNPDVPNQSRYGRARQLFEQMGNRVDRHGVRAILTDHANRDRFAGENPWIPGHGYSICNHGNLRSPTFDPQRTGWGSVSAEILDPVEGLFWYAYGWPCGEPPEYGEQMLQERSWGAFIGFPLDALPEGEYVTPSGELTALAAKHLDRLVPWIRDEGAVAAAREPALAASAR